MRYEAPKFAEVKMDAEISSYQDEFDYDREVPVFCERLSALAAEAAE